MEEGCLISIEFWAVVPEVFAGLPLPMVMLLAAQPGPVFFVDGERLADVNL